MSFLLMFLLIPVPLSEFMAPLPVVLFSIISIIIAPPPPVPQGTTRF